MSERITQELRDATTAGVGLSAFNGNVLEETLSVLRMDFESRCDAIDAVHANLERENESLRRELDRVLGEMEEHHAWAPESHYMLLPKDADGEPIHLFDLMETERGVETVEGILPDRFLVLRDGHWLTVEAATHRHHHADSWERIIKDAHDAGAHGKVFDLSEAVARCKALAGDAE
jgi:hypothetical protein